MKPEEPIWKRRRRRRRGGGEGHFDLPYPLTTTSITISAMALGDVHLRVGSDGIAFITIHNPPFNSLSTSMLCELKEKFQEALRRHDVKAIVLTGGGEHFSNGFYGESVEEVKREGELTSLIIEAKELQSYILNGVDGIKKPSVAAIKGRTHGAALALALCCSARIASHSAKLSFLELEYGPLTAVTGILLLPCMAKICDPDIQDALLSKLITAKEAEKWKLVSSITTDDKLLESARLKAYEMAGIPRSHWTDLTVGYAKIVNEDEKESYKPFGISSTHWTDQTTINEKNFSEQDKEAYNVLRIVKKQLKTSSVSSRHFLILLDALDANFSGGLLGSEEMEGKKSKEGYIEVIDSLLHVLFALQASEEVPGITNLGLEPRTMKRVGVVGGGPSAPGIVAYLILNKIPVVYKEANSDLLEDGLLHVKEKLQRHFKNRKDTKKIEKMLSLVKGVTDYTNFENLSIVLEAAVNYVQHKQQLFTDLENICSSSCILATTSTMDLNVIGEKTFAKDRIVGAHFVISNANKSPIIEIARTHKTSPQVIVDLMEFSKNMKKLPLVVRSCPGFSIHRTFHPYINSALILVDLGMDPYRIDYVAQSFGMPMGPFRRADHMGFEQAVEMDDIYLKHFPEHLHNSVLIQKLIGDKRYGERTCKGFYHYDEKNVARPDLEIRKYIEYSRSKADFGTFDKTITLSDDEVLEFLLFPVINEACRTIDENIVTRASDLDVASILYMGFPAYRGGILYWADKVGLYYVAKKLLAWSKTYGKVFKPCSLLESYAENNMKLSSIVHDGRSKI